MKFSKIAFFTKMGMPVFNGENCQEQKAIFIYLVSFVLLMIHKVYLNATKAK